MKIKIQLLALLLITNSFTFTSAVIEDSGFYGCVYIDDVTGPSGAVVTAWVDGVNWANDSNGLVWSTSRGCWLYQLYIPVDDPQDQEDSGAINGHNVTFKVNGLSANETGIAVSGEEQLIYLYAWWPPCDLNHDWIITKDWNDLMNAYKCFLRINKNCKINYQSWINIKEEYQCFVNAQ